MKTNAITAGILACFTLCAMCSAQSQDSLVQQDTAQKKIVLIAKGTTYLENAVAKILTDSLQARGFTIKTTAIKSIDAENPKSYVVSIAFSAIKASQILRPVRQYMSGMQDPTSKMLICSITGEPMGQESDRKVDAVTAPTRTLNPPVIARQILRSFDTVSQPLR